MTHINNLMSCTCCGGSRVWRGSWLLKKSLQQSDGEETRCLRCNEALSNFTRLHGLPRDINFSGFLVHQLTLARQRMIKFGTSNKCEAIANNGGYQCSNWANFIIEGRHICKVHKRAPSKAYVDNLHSERTSAMISTLVLLLKTDTKLWNTLQKEMK